MLLVSMSLNNLVPSLGSLSVALTWTGPLYREPSSPGEGPAHPPPTLESAVGVLPAPQPVSLIGDPVLSKSRNLEVYVWKCPGVQGPQQER